MSNTDYKSTDTLMRHLRNNGISISGTSQKLSYDLFLKFYRKELVKNYPSWKKLLLSFLFPLLHSNKDIHSCRYYMYRYPDSAHTRRLLFVPYQQKVKVAILQFVQSKSYLYRNYVLCRILANPSSLHNWQS